MTPDERGYQELEELDKVIEDLPRKVTGYFQVNIIGHLQTMMREKCYKDDSCAVPTPKYSQEEAAQVLTRWIRVQMAKGRDVTPLGHND